MNLLCVGVMNLGCVLLVFLATIDIPRVSGGTNDDNVLDTFEIIKSQNDKSKYKYLVLKNKLKILLISDPTVEKGAAAVSINAGYSSDPPSVPGIAHFCEHMLFLGTKKYPKESGFGLFLAQHNGRTNAYTTSEFTTYHFDINYDFFKPALDRFAQFFISPTFNQNATDRELNAIDQEHQKNVLDDSRRMFYIDRVSAKAGHRYGAFGTGNIDTLKTIPLKEGISIRDKLHKFYDKYYSANIMSVAVIGKQSIEELEKMTVPVFKDVKNNGIVLPSYSDNLPYGKDQLEVVLKFPTVKEINRLEIKFQILDLKEHYKEKIALYLSQTIGHEGEGSILSLLKNKGWALALWAGDRSGLKGFEFFIVGMELTKEGLERTDDIIGIIFQYINMLKREGPKQWIFDEMAIINTNRFRYKGKQHSRQYVQTLAKDLHMYPPEDVLYGHFRYSKYNPDLIKTVLGMLSPENFRCFIASQSFANQTNNKFVDYFNAGYLEQKIPPETITKWKNIGENADLALPKPNPFLPDTLNIVVPRKNVSVRTAPVLIKDTKLSRVWYKADDTFYVPKTSIKIGVYSPYASMSPSHYNHLNMFIRLVRYAMTEYGYDAQLADVGYDIRRFFNGFWINIYGFSSKQDVLLKKIMRHITSLDVDSNVFRLVKTQLRRSLKNQEVSVPYRQTMQLKEYVMNEKTWDFEERLRYLDDLTVTSFKVYMRQLLRDIYIESSFTGNLLKKDALSMVSIVENALIETHRARPMLSVQHSMSREYVLPAGSNYLYEKKSKLHAFSAVQIYLQVGLQTLRNNAMCEMFYLMTRTSIFVKLRTEQQLGYIVFSGLSKSHSVEGIRIQVQSDRAPSLVIARIEQFLKNFGKTLKAMTEKKFENYVDAAVVRKLEKPKKISEEAAINGFEIYKKSYMFNRRSREIEEFKKLKKDEMIEFFERYVDPESKLRKRLTVIVLGTKHTSILSDNNTSKQQWTPISDVLSFKTNLPLYRHMLPANGLPLVKT